MFFVTCLVVLFSLLSTVAYGTAYARMAQAELKDTQGKIVGLVTLSEDGTGAVHVVAHIHDLPPGIHAFHIHEAGVCTPPDFESAQGHFNPHGTEHGLMDTDGPHAGDLPNLVVAPDRTAIHATLAPLVTLGPGKHSLFQPQGTAFVVHQGADDYHTDPSGAAGTRIACGEIMQVK